MKRLIALLLSCCVLLGAVGIFASAAKEEPTKEEALKKSASRSYYKSLYAAGKSSFHGYCGLMTSCQLRALDINTWRVTNDGNKQFDYYAALDVTGGGYYITPYYLEDFTLEGALNDLTRYGTRDVYNILVGFQWTNTDAGRRYGHAVFINGILDGTVYFVESYDCSLDRYYPEGSVITCSIKDFADYYAGWTTYEGLIWFGNGEYADGCVETGTDVMIQTRFATTLRTQPSLVGLNDCGALRSVSTGERFRATGILEDPRGDVYYRVTDGDTTGYIAAGAAFVIRVNAEDLDVVDMDIPQLISEGEDAQLRGRVIAANGNVGAVEVTVTNSEGTLLQSARCDAQGYSWELGSLNEQLELDMLDEGVYLVQIYADCAQPVPAGQGFETKSMRIRLSGQVMQVGGTIRNGTAYPAVSKAVEQVCDGWVWEQGSWYCFEDGQRLTGWVESGGATYYLDETGAAVTGEKTLDGKVYNFSGSGALLPSTEE